MKDYKAEYVKDKNEIINAIEVLLEYVQQNKSELKSLENISEVERIKEDFSRKEFEIVVTGESGVGKSTFINMLVNRNILPKKPTKVMTYIKHSNLTHGVEGTKLHLKNGETNTINNEKLNRLSEKDLSEVEYLEIFLDSKFLKDGVVVVDTPSIATLSGSQKEIVDTKIKEATAHVFLSSAEQVEHKAEVEFVQNQDQTLFIVNKIDLIRPEEEEETIDAIIMDFSLKTTENLFFMSMLNDDHPLIAVKQQLDQIIFGCDKLQTEIAEAYKLITRHYALLMKENLLKTEVELENEAFLKRIDDNMDALFEKMRNN
ncbi:GTP-binding protein YsxC [Staphylococcus piscifermentans]|uniref:Dynamin N-terminal domain-containing protein n=1 Tax=Staphylococcus piscifermentans TaxID=70258 RepID=A0A239TFB6_9STAP|nr:dynamin family protein [Staphylococcus piscifermentans]GEP83623.1 hypothetical protein SPI02_02080 [Staphylococcus piscifermentans]SNU96381.1 GTP-binding protein YsxC [Staphylococcus piscifermentans]